MAEEVRGSVWLSFSNLRFGIVAHTVWTWVEEGLIKGSTKCQRNVIRDNIYGATKSEAWHVLDVLSELEFNFLDLERFHFVSLRTQSICTERG